MTKIGDEKKPPKVFTYEERCQQWLDKKPRDCKTTKRWMSVSNVGRNPGKLP